MVIASSIRGTVRERVLHSVEQVQAPQKVLILDSGTVKVVDSCVSMPEILDTGVFLIENIALGRQPYPSMAAVYIVAATEENVATMGKDFTPPTKKLVSGRTGPMYGEAHLFFTTSIPDTLMQVLAQSAVAPYVRTFQELFLDFVPAESRAFHTAVDRRFFSTLYAPMIPDGPEAPALATALDQVADRIAAACAVLGEAPKVRYRQAPGDCRSQRLALRVQKSLEDLNSKLGLRGGRGTLIIVDRTMDLLAPLMHEFTVQAMATDLLGLGPDGTRYEYSFSTLGGSASKTISLDERDNMWVTLRHAHIADCSNLIIERFNKFLMENKAAVKSRSGVTEDVTSLAELKDTMAALGEFQEMKSEYALHLSLAQACLSASDQKRLIEVAGIEQDVATGLDAEGDPVKDAWNSVAAMLDRPALTSSDRARLLGIYLLGNPKVGEAERRALFDHARLEADDSAALRQLLLLAEGRQYHQRPTGRPRGSKRPTCADDAPSYDVSRYIPALKMVLEDAAYEELSSSEFPFVKAEAAAASNAERAAPISLRARPTAGATASSGVPITTPTGAPPIFVYVLGGATYSEVRSVYELSESLKRDFFLGADALMAPSQFLANLRSVQ